ncbi:MAG TPA: SHD1 domain-containing protein, partial [Pirellulales bacterium]|nr:SHD1 domain-containing protein [Pirellulales bacterium]
MPSALLPAGANSHSGAIQPAVRRWVDATGRFSMTGTLLRGAADSVTLKRIEGPEVVVKIARLSEGDQQYVRQWLSTLAQPVVKDSAAPNSISAILNAVPTIKPVSPRHAPDAAPQPP